MIVTCRLAQRHKLGWNTQDRKWQLPTHRHLVCDDDIFLTYLICLLQAYHTNALMRIHMKMQEWEKHKHILLDSPGLRGQKVWGALTDSCADSKHLYRTELTARLLSDQVRHLFCQGTWFSIQNGEYWILYRCLYLALPIYDSQHWLPLLPLSVLVKLMLHLSEVGSMCLTTWQLKAAGWTHWCI